MTKYATIDMHSGFVWWVGEADSAKDACRKSDEVGGGCIVTDSYESVGVNDASYAVYEVPDEFDVLDGTDANEIEATQSHRRVGFYRRAAS